MTQRTWKAGLAALCVVALCVPVVVSFLLARHEAQRASRTSRRHLYWHVTSLLKVWSSAAFWRYWRRA